MLYFFIFNLTFGEFFAIINIVAAIFFGATRLSICSQCKVVKNVFS